jgi:hypothetical protein
MKRMGTIKHAQRLGKRLERRKIAREADIRRFNAGFGEMLPFVRHRAHYFLACRRLAFSSENKLRYARKTRRFSAVECDIIMVSITAENMHGGFLY